MEKERFRVMVSVNLVLIQNNKILLLERKNTGHRDGEYGFIAGHLEKGESIEDCLRREAKEEAGIDLVSEDYRFFHAFYRTNREYANFYFVAEQWRGEIQNMEPEKCANLTWFDLNNLPVNIIPYLKNVIESYQNGIYYSEDIAESKLC